MGIGLDLFIIIVLGLLCGAFLGWLLSRIFLGRHIKKIATDSPKRIEKQYKNFIVDGKPVDLKEVIKKEIKKTGDNPLSKSFANKDLAKPTGVIAGERRGIGGFNNKHKWREIK